MLPLFKSTFSVTCIIFTTLIVHAQTPNIVIIVCDDLNDSIEGIGGHPQAYTPNIDRIATSGVTFMNAASNAPVCGPSRASMWSGIHPITSGLYGANQQQNRWHNNPVLSSKTTLFETFINQGYYSYATGKIHHNGHESPYSTIMRNTDGYVGFEGQGKYRLSNANNSLPGGFGPYPNNSSNPVHNGVDPHWWPQEYKDRANPPYSGFGPYQDVSQYGGQWTNQTGGANNANFTSWNVGSRTPDEICADQAINFINSYEENKPFLLTIGFARPHSPYYAPEKFFSLPYVPALNDVLLANINTNDYNDITGPVNSSVKDLAQNSGWYKYTTYRNMGLDAYGDANRALRQFTQAYLACVAFVDEQVGKVLDALENSNDPNIRDNTLIIFTSDHGYHLGEKEFIFKHTPWEESVRVPFLVSGPGVAQNQICNQPISLVDIYATCIDYAGMTSPHSLDGNSIKPLLIDPSNGVWTGNAYSISGIASKYGYTENSNGYTSTFQSQYNNSVLPYSSAHFSIRTEQYRYIYYRDGEEELYDHIQDPNEWNNLAVLSGYEDVLAQMNLYYQYSVGLAIPPPPGPSFYFVKPTDGEGFYLNEPIQLEAEGMNISLSNVEFYIEGALIKNDSVAPYTARIYDASQGDLSLTAIGRQNSGDSLSETVTISIGTALGESLISDGGFESGSADSGLISFGPVNLSISSNLSFEGSNSFAVERTGTEVWHGLRYDLNLEDGETYQFSSKVLLEQDSDKIALTIKDNSPGLPSAYITIKELTDVQAATTSTDSQGNIISAGWLDVSAEFVYNSNMDFIYIAGVDAGENFYVDNISLSKVLPSANPDDTDADGMLDSWEQTNFTTTNTLPNDDADNDGVSNLLEYRSGTDPNNQYSFFGNYDFSSTASSAQMRWLGSADKLYRVLGTTDLDQWTVLEEAIQGHGTTLNTWVEDTTGTPNKFYKVEIDY